MVRLLASLFPIRPSPFVTTWQREHPSVIPDHALLFHCDSCGDVVVLDGFDDGHVLPHPNVRAQSGHGVSVAVLREVDTTHAPTADGGECPVLSHGRHRPVQHLHPPATVRTPCLQSVPWGLPDWVVVQRSALDAQRQQCVPLVERRTAPQHRVGAEGCPGVDAMTSGGAHQGAAACVPAWHPSMKRCTPRRHTPRPVAVAYLLLTTAQRRTGPPVRRCAAG